MLAHLLPRDVAVVEAIGHPADAALLPAEAAALGPVARRRLHEFTVARSCGRRALARLGLPITPILRGPHREPVWPPGVVGSITHRAGYHAAAVARRARIATIGIDAEVHERLPAGVLDLVTLPQERERLEALPRMDVHWDRVLFSAKESVYKAWFPITGRWLGFEDTLVVLEPRRATFEARFLVDGPILDGRSVRGFRGRYLVQGQRVLTAIALERRGERP